MTGLAVTARNDMLDQFAGVARFVSLHSADPGASGASELPEGSYVRAAVVWGKAAGGEVRSVSRMVFDVPKGSVTHVGYWTEERGGLFKGSRQLESDVQFPTYGTFTVESGDLVESLL